MAWTPSEERAVFRQVVSVVNDFQPFGIEFGTPDRPPIDEWSTEARAIESLLINKGQIEFGDLRAIWLEHFSEDLSGSEKGVQPLLDALNALVPQKPT